MPSNGDSEIAKANRAMNQAFRRKLYRQAELPTLSYTRPNCLDDDPTLLHIREPARKAVLRAAQFVVGVSSSIDGEPLARCSGFWIDFDNENKTGTIVTTALVIRTKHISKGDWFCKDQYACDAKVDVDLRGYKGYIMAEGHLLYYQKHYNLAFFRYDLGGPVIDLDGKVVGMIGSCSRGSFIPSSILLKCFHLWRNFQRIPRPHLGLKFNAISLLNPAHVEHILVECGIDEGLIVTEVSQDSSAKKCGIRNGTLLNVSMENVFLLLWSWKTCC